MKYAKSIDGLIHLIGAVNVEYTICGDAYDGEYGENGERGEDWSWVKCESGPVTCPKCAAQILQCRNVRIARQPDGAGEAGGGE
jgi:hypothetical protein